MSACPPQGGRGAPALLAGRQGKDSPRFYLTLPVTFQLEQNVPWKCWGSGTGWQQGGQRGRQRSTRSCATLGSAGSTTVPSSSCTSRMSGDGGVKWGGNTRGHELPALPALPVSSSPSSSLPQHGAERSTLITASSYESERLCKGCAATSAPCCPPTGSTRPPEQGRPSTALLQDEAPCRGTHCCYWAPLDTDLLLLKHF